MATVHRWIKDLQASGQAHVGSWRRCAGGGPPIAVYHAGAGVDVACRIARYTEAEKARRFRRRARRDGDWEDKLRAMRARYWAGKVPKRDPMVAALFGCS